MPKTKLSRFVSPTSSMLLLFAAFACSGSDGSDDASGSVAGEDPFSDASGADAGFELEPSAEPGAGTSGASDFVETSADGAGSDTSQVPDGAGGVDGAGGADSAGSANLDGGATGGDPVLPGDGFVTVDVNDAGAVAVLCGSEPCACGDGLDNDADGLPDGSDSECTGPFDHDEGSFATGIPGDNQDPKWQDCFFDGNSGAGDDGCRYHTDCLTGDAELDSPECTTSAECESYCEPLTPPGCDCFGCCQVESLTETLHILVVETCSLENIDDEMACPRCMPTELCQNECGVCEICLGQTLADLPPECFSDPPSGGAGSGGGANGGQGGGSSGNAGSGGSPGSAGNPGSGGLGQGGLGQGGLGQGGSDNPPPAGGGPNEPPPNFCGDGVTSCLSTEDCAGGAYCSLGCCRPFPAR